jgi:preprotein translocase subunit SecD
MSANISKSIKSQAKPGRTIAILAAILVAFSALAFIQNDKVKLGLDLRGGTSVTLQPRVAKGGSVSSAAIAQAVAIIRQRVNSLGVAESQVTSQGTGNNQQIVISVPGDTGTRIVDLVGQTAELRFRQVYAVGAGSAKTTATSTTSTSTVTVPKPGAKATPTPKATKAAVLTPTFPTGVTAALNTQFGALDCTKAANRQGGNIDTPSAPLIACNRDGTGKYILGPAEVVGTDVKSASANLDTTNGNGWMVLLNFTGSGTTKFGAITTRVTKLASPQNQVAVVLDGLVYTSPQINQAITGGNAQITGNFTQTQASDLANVLKYGALPLAFDRGNVQQVSPTLGANQLHDGLLAGLIGLILVVLYSVFYYRGLGIVSVGSLSVAGGITYLLFILLGKWIGFSLSLAGIAGAIVSIGITADSFIVYFERLRDEVRDGRSLRTAVDTGWTRAKRTIIVADSVSLIASALLYFFAVGDVRGFAFTLGLTTFVDLFVVFFFTKPLVSLLSRMHFYSSGHPLSGFSKKSLGVVTGKDVA